jgi:hypothetical protein
MDDTIHIHYDGISYLCTALGWLDKTIRNHSQYRLSTSNPFGFCPSYRTGTSTISPSEFRTFVGVSSTTRETILGYFFESHRKRAGTPWEGMQSQRRDRYRC